MTRENTGILLSFPNSFGSAQSIRRGFRGAESKTSSIQSTGYELGTAHVQHIAALIIGGVMAAPFGAYVVRHVPTHALMAVVGVLVSGLALFELVKSFS